MIESFMLIAYFDVIFEQKCKKLAPHEGIEPSTTSLKGWRSTAELTRLVRIMRNLFFIKYFYLILIIYMINSAKKFFFKIILLIF